MPHTPRRLPWFSLGLLLLAASLCAEPIRIGTLPGLRYDISEFSVKPGSEVEIVFTNDDDMEHNLVFTRTGARQAVVEAAMAMGAGGAEKDFIPDSRDVLWHIGIVPSGESETLKFTAPETDGSYPFVCTYPGHGYIMFGVMHVTWEDSPPVPTNPEMPQPEPEEGGIVEEFHHGHNVAGPAPEMDNHIRVVRAFMPEAGPASLAVNLGNGYAYCFDAGAVRFRYAWHGGFAEAVYRQPMKLLGEVFYREEHGYPLAIDGEPATDLQFDGYTLDGDGVPTFAYRVNGTRVTERIDSVGGMLERTFTVDGARQGVAFLTGGADWWSDTGAEAGDRISWSVADAKSFTVRLPTGMPVSMRDYYRIESLSLPEGEFSADAVEFLPDGRMMIAASLSRLYTYDFETETWALYADGLHTPLGLMAEDDGSVLVMQRPELTRMRDANGDGKVDTFETVSDYFGMSGNYAEFAFGPVRDTEGGLYFGLGTGSHYGAPLTNEVRGAYSEFGAWGRMNSPVPYRGWILRVAPDGTTQPWAVGFREPNGLGMDPEGRLFCIDNQGDWVGASAIFHIEEGGFYGHVPPLSWHPDFEGIQPLDTPSAELDRRRTRAAVVFPYGDMSNSPSEPIWDETDGKFGPFGGQMLIGEMNHRRVMRVMFEEVDGTVQGAVTPFYENAGLNLGNNRLAFAPDGSLWIGQTKHEAWVGESGLQQLTWRGVTPMEVENVTLTETGFEVRFTRPVEAASATDPSAYALRSYFYNYHENYGSPKMDTREIAVTAAELQADGRTVTLTLAELEPWRIYDFRLPEVVSTEGYPLVNNWLVYTLNRLRGGNTPAPPPPLDFETRPRREPTLPDGGVRGVGGPQ